MAAPAEIRLRGTAAQLDLIVAQMRGTFGDRILSVSEKYRDRRAGGAGSDTYRVYIKVRQEG